MQAEFLTPEEIVTLTGRDQPGSQKKWLDKHGWIYSTNAVGKTVISRLYCRQRLCGITVPQELDDGLPDFGKIA